MPEVWGTLLPPPLNILYVRRPEAQRGFGSWGFAKGQVVVIALPLTELLLGGARELTPVPSF